MRPSAYFLLCLFVPAVWGFVASAVYDRINARRKKSPTASDDGVDMYHI